MPGLALPKGQCGGDKGRLYRAHPPKNFERAFESESASEVVIAACYFEIGWEGEPYFSFLILDYVEWQKCISGFYMNSPEP